MIALSAEQAVEVVHDRQRVAEAETALAAEVTQNALAVASRMRTTECADQKLDDLGAFLDHAAAGHRLPPLGPFGRMRRPVLADSTWASVGASPVGTHLSTQELSELRTAYTYVNELLETSRDELRSWDALWTMVGPGRELGAPEEAQLRANLIAARSDNLVVAISGARFMEHIAKLDLPYTAEQRQALAKRVGEPLSDADLTHVCDAMTQPPPAHYGQSSSSLFKLTARTALQSGLRLGPRTKR